jgi:hypothetical protein
MQTVLAWLLAGIMLVSAYPWAAWLLAIRGSAADRWLPWLLALALSVGVLGLVMFYQSLAGIRLEAVPIALAYLGLMLPGWALWWRAGHPVTLPQPPASAYERLMLLIVLVVGAAVLFNAVYWPFYLDDAVNIYNHFGLQMAQIRAIIPLPGTDTLYEAYPILIPLGYTFSYLTSGWTNEYLARLTPALLSLGCIPAAYTLGVALHGRTAAGLAALLLITSPAFVRWASSGYVDLPMAFFYTLAAVFAWRLWQRNQAVDALLVGLMLGLAAWTKNAALLAFVFMALWLLWGIIRGRIGLLCATLTLGTAAVIAGPWYVRNWLQAGLIMPDTAWTEQADQTLAAALIFIKRPHIYGLTGVLCLIGIGYGIWTLTQQRLQAAGHVLLLLWTLPFFAAWWLFVSYDPRFLLLFLPPLCVLAGIWLAETWRRIPQPWQRRTLVPLVCIALLLMAQSAWRGVEFKRALLQDPLMDDASKHEVVFRQR